MECALADGGSIIRPFSLYLNTCYYQPTTQFTTNDAESNNTFALSILEWLAVQHKCSLIAFIVSIHCESDDVGGGLPGIIQCPNPVSVTGHDMLVIT